MIISRSPFRISFAGGGSDLKAFYRNNGGAVVSTSIDKYIYLSAHKYFEPKKSLIKYSITELIEDNEKIKHPIIKEVFNYFNIKNIDFNSTADVPSGTGLGSSSTFTSALIKLCLELNKKNLSKYDIAELASYFEIEKLKEPIGKQDQYAATYGGLNFIKFNSDSTVNIEKINLNENSKNKLNNSLYLFYTGLRRSTKSILKVQNQNMKENIKTDNIKHMVKLSYNLRDELKNQNIDSLGDILNEGWMKKRELTKDISNSKIDDMYNYAIECGSSGGKLLGAGAGGFLLFYCSNKNKKNFLQKFKILPMLNFKMEESGTKIIFNDDRNNK